MLLIAGNRIIARNYRPLRGMCWSLQGLFPSRQLNDYLYRLFFLNLNTPSNLTKTKKYVYINLVIVLSCECGGKIKIEYIPANQLLEIVKLANKSNYQFIAIDQTELTSEKAIIGLIGATLNSMTIAQISFCGERELVVTFCENCGLIYCSGCKNPFIADPQKEYTCIFCGGQ